MPEGEPEFECPNCHEPVDLDWKACPGCGVEFDTSEPGEAEAQTAPAAAAAPADAPAAAEAGGGDELDELAATIERVTAPPAPPPPPPARAPPAGAPAKARGPRAPAKATAAKVGAPPSKLGGTLGIAGLLLLLAGLVGAMVALNYDVWVKGLTTNTIGTTQTLATVAMLVVAGIGIFLLLRGMGKSKRRATPAR